MGVSNKEIQGMQKVILDLTWLKFTKGISLHLRSKPPSLQMASLEI
jgi:hypothetical protein